MGQRDLMAYDDVMKPSVIPNLYEVVRDFRSIGLRFDDLITILQRRTKLSRTVVTKTLNELLELEKQMIAAESKRQT